MKTRGLALEQAPPLSIPATFFVTAPLFVAAAGLLLCVEGGGALVSGYFPATLLLTHLGTLGFLGTVMFGAIYQMTPVVAGAPVPGVRSAYAVWGLLVIGLGAVGLVLGGIWDTSLHAGFGFVELATLIFVGTVGWALVRRATATHETVVGMRMAIAALFVVVLLGTVMERALGGDPRPGAREVWMQVHLTLALLGWVGALITSVSWQIVPMFYLAPEIPRSTRRATLRVLGVGLALPAGVLGLEALGRLPAGLEPGAWAALAAAPAALVVWAWHPWTMARTIAARARRRGDAGLLFWRAGLAVGPLLIAVGAWASFGDEPRAAVLFGWLAIWGWAGLIVHGMLGRIVPFLVWFHRYSGDVGRADVPSMKDLLPDARMRRGFGLHGASLVIGAAAILAQSDGLARLTGGLVIVTAAALLQALGGALRRRPA